MAIKKSGLYSSLWASCDELRGGMDASQNKDYVLFMLFIKYVSDKYGDSDDFAPPVVIPKGASFKDMVALKGNGDIGKPIPSYQVYKGTVFALVDQAVDFVMSKINLSVGTRAAGPQAPVRYEIPREVVAEAIVNAVAHRDYTSNGSVQVSVRESPPVSE